MSSISFAIVYSFLWLLGLFPFRCLYILSDIITFFLRDVFKYRQQIILNNLRNSFPKKSDDEIKQIARKYYAHLSDTFVETIKLIHISESEMQKRCKYNNLTIVDELFAQKRSIVAVIGHYGNWEYMIGFPFFTKYNVLTLYKPLTNKKFNNFYIKLRSKFGVKPVSMKESYKKLMEYKQGNIPTITAFISDQTPHKDEIQYWTNFLNQDTAVFLGPEKIAKKLDFTVLYFQMRKVKRGFYEMDISTLTNNPKNTAEYEITNLHVKKLEETIKLQPEYWLWSHRRWKTKKV
ncbi:MAG TPA: hypothetical protein DDX39_11225 [Bacteroidales bacterium]|nr:MAG: hypothetical protein A2W98_13820 [Bacteroidetes bacterium GWF2_33_38]OFY90987.1 MAG: hypothetical protein A2236_03455 [Bacteroidetes bacterium RIFOXYA2_FULL_33_7]HBF89203.1 hypothetical protein [Bacteroidales bacterium]